MGHRPEHLYILILNLSYFFCTKLDAQNYFNSKKLVVNLYIQLNECQLFMRMCTFIRLVHEHNQFSLNRPYEAVCAAPLVSRFQSQKCSQIAKRRMSWQIILIEYEQKSYSTNNVILGIIWEWFDIKLDAIQSMARGQVDMTVTLEILDKMILYPTEGVVTLFDDLSKNTEATQLYWLLSWQMAIKSKITQ